MLKTGQNQNDGKQDWQKTDARVLGQILAAQNILFVLPDSARIAGFFSQSLVSVPGVTSCRVCLGDVSVQVGLDSEVCRDCVALRKEAGEKQAMPFGFQCRLAEQHDLNIIIIRLETSNNTYGFVVFRTDTTGVFECYRPFINNLSNYIALSLETRLQKNLLQEAHDELERRVEERAKELNKVNEQLEEDISERKRTENALIESEAHYRGLFEHSPVSLWEEDFSDVKRLVDELRASGVSDLRAYFEEHPEELDRFVSATKIISVNQATLRLFKADSKERLLEGLNIFFSKESLDIFKEELITFANGDTQSQSEVVLRNLADDQLFAVVRFSMAPGHTNTWGKVFLSVSDITRLKQAEEKLRQSERISTIMARIATVFLTVPDEEVYGEVLRVVLEVMESRFGIFGFIADNGDLVIPSMTREVWSKCQVPDKSIVFPPHTWGGGLWGRAIREKKTLYSNDPFHVPEGHIPIFNFLAAPVVFQDKTIGLLSVGNKDGGYTEEAKELLELIANAISPILNARLQRDFQEHQRATAEDSLKTLSHKFSLILNSAGEGIYGVDLDGNVTFVNPAAARILGYEVEELLGRPGHATWHHHYPDGTPFPAEKCGLSEALKKGIPCLTESAVFWKKNGTQFPVEYSSTPMFEAERLVGAVVIFRDNAEKARLDNQLRQAQKMEAVGTLAGGIAHDFNNILAVIMAYGEMARMNMIPADPLRRNLDNMLEAAGRAAHLTQSLLSFSRKQLMERRHEDLNHLLKRVEKFLTRVIGEDIALTTRLPGEEIPVFVDAPQIEQVLMNLATNARDAMPGGGDLTITAEKCSLDEEAVVELGYGKPGAYALITVTDTGVGMPKEVRQRIFEPFFTTKEVGKGTGLGLAVAYGIVKQHDGYITVQSEPGQGTTFKIFLPLVATVAAEAHPANRTVEYQAGTETILLAEDNELLRSATAEQLRSFGYTVVEARDGEEAVRLFRENSGRVHLCLFDLMMPKKSGREAFEEIQKAAPDARVLFTSGYAGETLRQRGLSAESMQIIHKPASTAELLKKIREVLDQSAPAHEALAAARPGSRVLMIDDDEQYREVVRHFCTKRGHVFAGVDSAAAALATLAGQPFDVLLVDLNIPGTSGEHVLREIRAAGHAAPAIVLTGDLSSADLAVLRPLGVVRALEKSGESEPLLRAIAEAQAPEGSSGQ